MKIDSKFVRNALARHQVWDVGNDALYELCRNHPYHESVDSIIAKVWLIGRSYAAAIERRIDTRQVGSDDFYVKVVGPTMKRAKIDAWLVDLRNLERPNAELTVPAHARLTSLFSTISGIEKRSLASKYLHFHIPRVAYIYDSRAAQAICRVTTWSRQQLLVSDSCDRQYARFYARCELFRERLEQLSGRALSPRDVDTVLLAVSRRL